MKPVITTRDPMNVVGLGTTFISILSPDRNNHIVIPELWDAFIARMDEIIHCTGDVTVGVCGALPQDFPRTHEHQMFYMACLPVDSFDDIPEGMMRDTIPGGQYAAFTHVGPISTLGDTMRHIYGA